MAHVTLRQGFVSGMKTPFKNTIFSQLKFAIDTKWNAVSSSELGPPARCFSFSGSWGWEGGKILELFFFFATFERISLLRILGFLLKQNQ